MTNSGISGITGGEPAGSDKASFRGYEEVAMLDLQDGERQLLEKHVKELTGGFGALGRVDTGDTAPLVTTLDLKNVFREDIAMAPFSRDELLANAPDRHDGYFRVPETI